MNKIQFILAVAFVGIIGNMTMIAGFPSLYSPYSFTVVVPAIFCADLNLPSIIVRLISVIPLIVFYIAWAFVFVRSPFRITLTQKLIVGLLVILSAIYNVSSYDYGLKYQGKTHTNFICAYNLIFVLVLSILLTRQINISFILA